VLVVDDNADMRGYIKNLLKKQYRVVTANNGMDALHKIKEYTPQLIVSDIMMPVMNGIQLLKAVKEAVQTQHIPVILLSARAGEESKIEGYETGADDYLVKPFSAKELLARVASQLKLVKLRLATDTNVRNLFMQAPASICVLRGPQHIYHLANSMYLQLIGRSDIIGKSVREALPELEGSGIYELLDEVYRTGEPFIAREMPVSIQKDNGTLKEIILNFIYQPSRNEEKEIDGILVYAVDITDQIIARKKIEKSEEHLQDIFYQAPAAIAVLEGESHKYVLANSLYQKMISRSEEQLLGKTVKEVFPELGASGVFQIFDAVFKTGEPFIAPEFEAMIDRFNDGVPHTTYYNFTLKPLKTEDKVTSLMVVAYDITEQVEARKKVEDSEKRYHHLIQSSPSAIGILKGKDLVITIANDAIMQIWGKGKNVFGKKYFEMMPELAEQGYEEVFKTVYTTGVPFNAIETPVTISQDGEMRLRYYNFYLFPQKDLNGSIDGLGIIANEVTSQALTNKQIKESENRFQNLVREATVGIIVLTGEEMKVEIVNEAYAKLVGLRPDELLGNPLFDKIPDAKEYYLPLLEKVRQTGDPIYLNDSPYSVVTKGEKIEGFLHVVYQPYRDIAGNILGVMVIVQDVTESVLSKQKLQENEERFRTLSNSIPQLAWMTDAKGWIYWYNQRWYDYTGTTLEQMQGWGWQSVHHPDLVEGIKRDFADAIAKGEPYDDTFLLRSKEGNYRWFLTRAVPIRNAVGEIVQWFGTNTDVSAQREIEEALKVAKEQLELTFKNVPSAIYHFDKTGNILYLNDKGAHQMGYATVEDVMAEKDVFQLRKKADETFAIMDEKGKPLPAGQSSAALTFKTGRASEVVSQFIHRETGSAFWLLARSTPLYNENGELSIVLTTSTDITLQKTSEQTIRQSEEKFRTLAEALPQLIWMTDEKGVQEYASSRWKEYAGFEPQGLETWAKMVHPDDMPLITQTWMNSIQYGDLYKAEARLRNEKGEYRWHFVKGEPIRNEEGKIIKWIGAFTDIHDQKTVEEKLEKIVAKRTKELERSNEDLQQFAHVASHDLKEPIRKIKTFGGRLAQEFGSDLPEKAKTYVAKMESAANRVYAMIDGVLMYSSLDAEVVPAERIVLDETIRDIEADLELLIAQKNATLQYQDLPSIEGSSILIYQLFYNLINNALKFSKNEVPTTIDIAAGSVQAADLKKYGLGGTEENYVRIVIKDNGIGFSFLEAEKIFKTFARLHSKDQYEGSGLGLALCKKIVGRHGGAISATGEENGGATFEVILPLKPRKITDVPFR
jgi:PAS domain S-box-containing protein